MRSGQTRALPCSPLPGRGSRPKACLDVASTTPCASSPVRTRSVENSLLAKVELQVLLEANGLAGDPCRISASRISGARANTLKRMSKEDPGANQAHHCRHCFDHRKTSFCAPREGNAVHPRTVKMIQVPQNEITPHWGFRATYVSIRVHLKQIRVRARQQPSRVACGRVWQAPVNHSAPTPFPPRSGCVILVH